MEIAKKLKDYGVQERVIIHTPEVGVCVSENGVQLVPAYQLPENFIVGTTGAGDAFCAGALIGIYQGKTDKEILEFASAWLSLRYLARMRLADFARNKK